MQEVIYTIIIAFSILCVFTFSEMMSRIWKIKVEITRKFVHITSGLITLSFPMLIHDHFYVLILCTLFVLLLIISKKFDYLRSVHKVTRNTHGSYLFPLSVYICFLIYKYYDQQVFFFLPVFILSISDPIAAFSGIYWKKLQVRQNKLKVIGNQKTFAGTLMFFVSAFLACVVMLSFQYKITSTELVIISLSIGIISSYIESVSHGGWDNLNIPLSVAAVLILLKEYLLNFGS